VRRSHSTGGPCKLLGDRPLPSILHLAPDETRCTRTVLVAIIMTLISMKSKKIKSANESTRLRYAFLPPIVEAHDPGVFLIIIPNASDGASKALCHTLQSQIFFAGLAHALSRMYINI